MLPKVLAKLLSYAIFICPITMPLPLLEPSVYQVRSLFLSSRNPVSHSLLSENLMPNGLLNVYLTIILSALVCKGVTYLCPITC